MRPLCILHKDEAGGRGSISFCSCVCGYQNIMHFNERFALSMCLGSSVIREIIQKGEECVAA